MQNPSRILEQLERFATEIVIGEGEQRSIDLKIVTPDKQ